MTQKEYEAKMKKIESDFEKAKINLYVEYAKSQRKFKIGDIIKDSTIMILVEKFGTNKTFGMPQPTYIGKELKKDFSPKKSGEIGYIYGNDNVEFVKSILV